MDNSQLPRKMAPVSIQQLQEMRFDEALEYLGPELLPALPSHIPLDRFKRVVLTAVNQTPDLARADRRSLFNACVRCAHDGLYPDGREAALVVFRTKVKRKIKENGQLVEREFYADLVQYLPMIAGIRKRMRNTGEVLSSEAHVVHRHDKFYRSLGDEPKIIHEPPPLDQDRGDPIGAYAIIRLRNGEHIREVMGYPEIELVRGFSRSKDGPAWRNWWGEMARKTVLRRCSKAAPTGSELERLLAEDDEIPQIGEHTPLLEIPPRPRPEDYADHVEAFTNNDKEDEAQVDDPTDDGIEIVGVDGEIEAADDPEMAVDALLAQIAEAAQLGESRLKGLWESNQPAIEEIEGISRELAGPIYTAFREALAPFHPQKEPQDHGRVERGGDERGGGSPVADSSSGKVGQERDDASGGGELGEPSLPPPEVGGRRRGRPSRPRQQQPNSQPAERRSVPTNSPVTAPQAAPKSPPAETPATLAVPLVQLGQGKTDWQETALRMVARVKGCTLLDDVKPLPIGRFRRENLEAMNLLRAADRDAWVSVEYALGQKMRQLQIAASR